MKRVFAYEIQMISYYISEFMNLKKKPSAIIKINIHPKFKRYLIEKLNINDKRYKEVPDLIKNFYLKKYFRSQMSFGTVKLISFELKLNKTKFSIIKKKIRTITTKSPTILSIRMKKIRDLREDSLESLVNFERSHSN